MMILLVVGRDMYRRTSSPQNGEESELKKTTLKQLYQRN